MPFRGRARQRAARRAKQRAQRHARIARKQMRVAMAHVVRAADLKRRELKMRGRRRGGGGGGGILGTIGGIVGPILGGLGI